MLLSVSVGMSETGIATSLVLHFYFRNFGSYFHPLKFVTIITSCTQPPVSVPIPDTGDRHILSFNLLSEEFCWIFSPTLNCSYYNLLHSTPSIGTDTRRWYKYSQRAAGTWGFSCASGCRGHCRWRGRWQEVGGSCSWWVSGRPRKYWEPTHIHSGC